MLAGAPAPVHGQGLPFPVTIVDWDRATLERQRRAFRAEAEEREVLFCVESWTRIAAADGTNRVVITGVRRARSGAKRRIDNVAADCLDEGGNPLPMFHTHSDGNCQLSPSDLVTLAVRGAPFEGAQWGERPFVWAFAWQVAALAAAAELGGIPPGAPTPATYPAPPRPPPPR